MIRASRFSLTRQSGFFSSAATAATSSAASITSFNNINKSAAQNINNTNINLNNNISKMCCVAQNVSQKRFSSSASGFDKLHPLHKELDALIGKGRIVVFLTGTPSEPQCGFTIRMVDILEQLPIKYEFVNIMESDEICEGLKTYSNWPTYPQLYIDKELIGGYDITRQMVLDGSLIKLFKEKGLLIQ